MAEQIISASGVQYGLIVNPDGSINTSAGASVGSIVPVGYTREETIRKASGSPAVNFIFSSGVQSLMIENLGSSPVYVDFDTTVNPASSGAYFLDKKQNISLDLQVGSVSIQGSGTTSPVCQVVGVY